MMSVKYSAKVFGYVPKALKLRMQKVRKKDWRMSESRLIQEALEKHLPAIEGELFKAPSQDLPAHRIAVGA